MDMTRPTEPLSKEREAEIRLRAMVPGATKGDDVLTLAAELDRLRLAHAAELEALRERCAKMAEEHDEHGEFAHGGRMDCLTELASEIRALPLTEEADRDR